jgi:hypothetical protein
VTNEIPGWEMRLINALCLFAEMAKAIEPVITSHSEGSVWYSELNEK